MFNFGFEQFESMVLDNHPQFLSLSAAMNSRGLALLTAVAVIVLITTTAVF
ncbi:MAG: hypothetical protein IJI14_17660 [Anaerolineaceae bacterium]|nr:hypothetical protein [Anaerolineaceae bacterium]